MASESAGRYWTQFVRSSPAGSARPRACYEAFHFGSGVDATSIAALVVDGTKTSTASMQWVYDAEGRRPPIPGDLSSVLDGLDHPVCIIETTEVKVVPYEDMVDQKFAYEGGEGDRTLEGWRPSGRSTARHSRWRRSP